MIENKEEKRLRLLAKEALGYLGYKDSTAEVNLVNGRVMRSLNRRFRGKNSTTNVLAFPAPAAWKSFPAHSPRFLGEIYLDLVYIKKRKEDIDYLLIHGLLHLLGFGHERYDDRIKMERLEMRILRWQKTRF